jgi:multidrug efflux system outer membrane protein
LLLDTLKLRDESVALQKDRYQAGVIGEYDLRTAEAERASVAGDIAVARRAVTEFESALAVLLGRSPREVFSPSIARDVEIARLTAVPTLPSGVPSDLLLRRPDIQRAEAQLAAANLRIDVARDDYYPAISLTGNYGTQAGALKNLFTGPGVVWGLAASLLQPLIGLKAIEANVEAQTARRSEAPAGARAVGTSLHVGLFAVPRGARRAASAVAGADPADHRRAQRAPVACRFRESGRRRMGLQDSGGTPLKPATDATEP